MNRNQKTSYALRAAVTVVLAVAVFVAILTGLNLTLEKLGFGFGERTFAVTMIGAALGAGFVHFYHKVMR